MSGQGLQKKEPRWDQVDKRFITREESSRRNGEDWESLHTVTQV